MAGLIRVGIGGWTFEPWRDGVFFPEKWPAKRELEYASQRLTAIEVNGTYYSSFKPETFAKWRKETPDGFVFTLKASRFCTNRKVLATAEESITRFVSQGILELGDKLGPILWQFMATKKFDPEDFKAFLTLLPHAHEGVPLRHAVHVRNASFHTPEFVVMCRAAGVAIVYADSAEYPDIADVTADFVYSRLEDANPECETGYTPGELDRWAEVAKCWAAGAAPDSLPYVDQTAHHPAPARDVFVFMINGAKERCPAAAMALIERL